MARSLNKAQLIGHLGKDPEVKNFSNGGSVVTFSIATSDQWKDRTTGERREKTEWHRVAIFSEPIGRIAQQWLRKGDLVFIEGKMETRKWTDQQGQDRYTTEVVVRPYQGEMTLLGGRGSARGNQDSVGGASQERNGSGHGYRDPNAAPTHSYQGPGPREPFSRNGAGYGGDYGGGQQYHYPDDEIPF